MQALLNVSIPVFAIILTGYLAGRLKLLGQDSTAALNGLLLAAFLCLALEAYAVRRA